MEVQLFETRRSLVNSFRVTFYLVDLQGLTGGHEPCFLHLIRCHLVPAPLWETDNLHETGSWTVEGEVIGLASVIVVEGEDTIVGGHEIVATDANARVGRTQGACGVFPNLEKPGAGPVKQEMIQTARVLVVKRKRAILGRIDFGAADTVAFIHRDKGPAGVLQDDRAPLARPVEQQVIGLAAVVIVEGEELVGGRLRNARRYARDTVLTGENFPSMLVRISRLRPPGR